MYYMYKLSISRKTSPPFRRRVEVIFSGASWWPPPWPSASRIRIRRGPPWGNDARGFMGIQWIHNGYITDIIYINIYMKLYIYMCVCV